MILFFSRTVATAVSYTHLVARYLKSIVCYYDVYGEFPPLLDKIKYIHNIEPVSYTHLDVYKRQSSTNIHFALQEE